jgi:hypothetical protein
MWSRTHPRIWMTFKLLLICFNDHLYLCMICKLQHLKCIHCIKNNISIQPLLKCCLPRSVYDGSQEGSVATCGTSWLQHLSMMSTITIVILIPSCHHYLQKWLIGACRLVVVAALLYVQQIQVGGYHHAAISILEAMNGQHPNLDVGCCHADRRYQ